MTTRRTTQEIHADYQTRRNALRDRLHRIVLALEAAENTIPEAAAPEMDTLIDILDAYDYVYKLGVEFGAQTGAETVLAELDRKSRAWGQR